MKKYEDKFLGPNRIKFATPAGHTSGGVNLIELTLENNKRETYSALMLEAQNVITPQPQDLSSLRTYRMYPVVTQILEVMRDHNVKLDEISFMVQLVSTSVNENLDRVDKDVWGVESLGDRTFVQIDQKMKTIKTTLGDVLPAA